MRPIVTQPKALLPNAHAHNAYAHRHTRACTHTHAHPHAHTRANTHVHTHAHEHTRGVLVIAVAELSTRTWVGLRGPTSLGHLLPFRAQGHLCPAPAPAEHGLPRSTRSPADLAPVSAGLWPVPCPRRSWPGGVSATGHGRLVVVGGLDQSVWFSPELLWADRAEAACHGLSLWGAPVVGGGLLIVLLSEVHRTETLTDQELGCNPWPLASLSQGDLFGNALRPEARVAGGPWFPGGIRKRSAQRNLD